MVNTYTDGACALKLPSSYVPMTSEEMEYVEGGGVHIANWIIGGAVNLAFDVALAATGGWFFNKGTKLLTQAGKTLFSKKLKAKLVAKGVTSYAAGIVCTKALTFIGNLFNPGDLVATWLDAHDKLGTTGFLDL